MTAPFVLAAAGAAADVTPWFPIEAAGWHGAIMGSFVGAFYGGLVGGVGLHLANKGSARSLVLGAMTGGVLFSLACAVTGVIALSLRQPYHVWYPFLLIGGVGLLALGSAFLTIREKYRANEQRRVEARLIAGDASATRAAPPSYTGPAAALVSMLAGVIVAIATLLFAGDARADTQSSAAPPDQHERAFTLDNGADVRLFPFPGIGWAGVVAAYDVGFLHEPEGRPQIAHLVEHLRLTAPVGDDAANEVWSNLSAIGSANAETQTGFTYYDILVPSERLEDALRAEAHRLTSLSPSQDDLLREGPRAASEATGMLAMRDPFLHKFALMAAAQGWAHAATTATLVTELGDLPIAEAEAFRTSHYTPGSLTLLIAGDFDPVGVRDIIDRTIGAVPEAPTASTPAIDWGDQPKTHRITWDLPRSVVIIAHEPPADPFERFALTAAMALLPAVLQTDPPESVGQVLGSGFHWPVGETPVMALGVVRDGFTTDQAISEITERLDAFAAEGLPTRLVLPLRRGQTLPALPSGRILERQAQRIAAMRGMEESQATGMAALQTALNMLTLERAAPADPDALRERLRQMSADDWRTLLARSLAPERRFTTIIEPAPDVRAH
jgi:predicted Zn-dependent peptidase